MMHCAAGKGAALLVHQTNNAFVMITGRQKMLSDITYHYGLLCSEFPQGRKWGPQPGKAQWGQKRLRDAAAGAVRLRGQDWCC